MPTASNIDSAINQIYCRVYTCSYRNFPSNSHLSWILGVILSKPPIHSITNECLLVRELFKFVICALRRKEARLTFFLSSRFLPFFMLLVKNLIEVCHQWRTWLFLSYRLFLWHSLPYCASARWAVSRQSNLVPCFLVEVRRCFLVHMSFSDQSHRDATMLVCSCRASSFSYL